MRDGLRCICCCISVFILLCSRCRCSPCSCSARSLVPSATSSTSSSPAPSPPPAAPWSMMPSACCGSGGTPSALDSSTRSASDAASASARRLDAAVPMLLRCVRGRRLRVQSRKCRWQSGTLALFSRKLGFVRDANESVLPPAPGTGTRASQTGFRSSVSRTRGEGDTEKSYAFGPIPNRNLAFSRPCTRGPYDGCKCPVCEAVRNPVAFLRSFCIEFE